MKYVEAFIMITKLQKARQSIFDKAILLKLQQLEVGGMLPSRLMGRGLRGFEIVLQSTPKRSLKIRLFQIWQDILVLCRKYFDLKLKVRNDRNDSGSKSAQFFEAQFFRIGNFPKILFVLSVALFTAALEKQRQMDKKMKKERMHLGGRRKDEQRRFENGRLMKVQTSVFSNVLNPVYSVALYKRVRFSF